MRVLAISSTPPLPADSAMRLRTWHLLSRLARRAEVALVTWERPGNTSDMDALRSSFSEVISLSIEPVNTGQLSRISRQARFLAGGLPPYVQAMLADRGLTGSRRDRFRQLVEEMNQAGRFDAAILEEEALRFTPVPNGIPVVLHRHNVFERLLGDIRRQRLSGRGLWTVERSAWKRFDRKVMRGLAMASAPTPEVAAEIERIAPEIPVVTLPSGADLRRLKTAPAASKDVAFIGWMGYRPNIDAVRWFAREVWPEMSKRFPDARFRIIGREPVDEVLAMRGDGVQVLGAVPDVADACEGVRVGVVPLFAGMGIKNKTIEMMAMGLPVVTTKVGAEGLSAGPGDGLFVVGGREGFLTTLTGLYADPGRVARLGEAAKSYVERNHSWDVIGSKFTQALERLVAGAPLTT